MKPSSGFIDSQEVGNACIFKKCLFFLRGLRMPVFEIKALPQKSGVLPQVALKKLCCEIATLMQISESQVWATWQTIEPGLYVEGGVAAELQPDKTHPPIVNLIAFEGRPQALMEKVVERAAEILSSELQLGQGNIYMHLTETLSGRTYTGGQLRKR
jgi:hypothetical protein